MSVLSRRKVDVPQPRTGSPTTTPPASEQTAPTSRRPLALLAAGIVAAAAIGTGVYFAVNDDGPSTPATTIAPQSTNDDVLSERVERENQRDEARARNFAE